MQFVRLIAQASIVAAFMIAPTQVAASERALRRESSVGATMTAPAIPPAWPLRYRATVMMSGFFEKYNATVAFDFAAGLERFDFVEGPVLEGEGMDDKSKYPTVSHIYNFTAQRQYVVTSNGVTSDSQLLKENKGPQEKEAKCFFLPLRAFKEILPTPLEHYRHASLVNANVSLDGEVLWQYRVPVFEDKLSVDLFISSSTQLPRRISTHTLVVDFLKVNTSEFENPHLTFGVPSSLDCRGPYPPTESNVIGTSLSLTATEYPELDPLLFPRWSGYQGGDGGQSAVLDSNRVYVVADDLFFGFRLHGQRMKMFGMAHNVVVLVSGPNATSPFPAPSRVTYHAEWVMPSPLSPNGDFSDFWKPANWSPGARYVWTSGGVVINDTMLMLTMELMGGNTPPRPVMLHVRNVSLPDPPSSPADWPTTFDYGVPFSQDKLDIFALATNIGGSMVLSSDESGTPDGYLYIPGHKNGWLGIERHFFLSRVPLADAMRQHWNNTVQYWSAKRQTWVSQFNALDSDFEPIFSSDAPCSTLFYHSGLRLYVALTTKGGSAIGVAFAKKITGPYHEQRVAYRIPPLMADGYDAYCPAPHLQWAKNKSQIVLTYFEDSYGPKLREATSSNMYEARFVVIDVEGSL